MARVKSGNSTDLWTIDPTSKAGRGTLYSSAGVELLGQHLAAASIPVVLPSDQVSPLPTGASTSANQATEIASLASIDGKLNSLGQKAMAASVPVVLASDQNPPTIYEASSPLVVSVTGASGAAVTATLAAIANQFHYITMIEIVKFAAVALTASGTPTVVTTTNLPGSLAFTFDSAGALGTSINLRHFLNSPLKSSVVNTNTTIVCPATTSVIWRVNVYYYGAA